MKPRNLEEMKVFAKTAWLWLLVAVVGTGQVLRAQDMGETSIADEGNRFAITIGPVDLPAAGEHSHGAHGGVWPPVAEVQIPGHGYVTGFEWEIVNASGEQMPRAVLHHLNLIDPRHRELFLPISQRVAAVGNETQDIKLPGFFLGYPVMAGQPIVVSAMMHNPTGAELNDVYVKFYLNYTPTGRPWPLFDVFPFQLDVAFPAGDKSFSIPPGVSTWSYDASPAMPGRLMGIGGHLHPHAVNITFSDVETGEVIYEGLPIPGEGEELGGVTIGKLYLRGGEFISPEKTYRVSVTYDNPFPDSLPEGGMGVVGGIFMPTGGYPWPTADVSDELYQLDRNHYLRALQGKMDEIMAQSAGDPLPPAEDEHPAGTPAHEH